MGQLIDDLLSLSQVGRRQVGREPLDMNRMIAEVAEELRGTEPDRQIELRLADVPPAAGEGVLIRQMLVNLLQNAIKFTRTRPVATIETGAIEKDGEVVYFVRDNGVGFSMQYSWRVFDPFHRLHTADDFEGTGIGLAIVHRIIAKHGGRVWAESAEGEGATFYFTLAARALEAA
jgi:light-regulated signal transduction histidine kinase (bacteriophytochrome)